MPQNIHDLPLQPISDIRLPKKYTRVTTFNVLIFQQQRLPKLTTWNDERNKSVIYESREIFRYGWLQSEISAQPRFFAI